MIWRAHALSTFRRYRRYESYVDYGEETRAHDNRVEARVGGAESVALFPAPRGIIRGGLPTEPTEEKGGAESEPVEIR